MQERKHSRLKGGRTQLIYQGRHPIAVASTSRLVNVRVQVAAPQHLVQQRLHKMSTPVAPRRVKGKQALGFAIDFCNCDCRFTRGLGGIAGSWAASFVPARRISAATTPPIAPASPSAATALRTRSTSS